MTQSPTRKVEDREAASD